MNVSRSELNFQTHYAIALRRLAGAVLLVYPQQVYGIFDVDGVAVSIGRRNDRTRPEDLGICNLAGRIADARKMLLVEPGQCDRQRMSNKELHPGAGAAAEECRQWK